MTPRCTARAALKGLLLFAGLGIIYYAHVLLIRRESREGDLVIKSNKGESSFNSWCDGAENIYESVVLFSDCLHFECSLYHASTPNIQSLVKNVHTTRREREVVDLLTAVYRPQNVYCIHVDQKSPSAFRLAMESVSRCFPNVFLASRSIDVTWGTSSVLEPEIVCMEDLWRRSTAWKYFINLTGQEFPLKTNYELVRILMAYNGANDISAGYALNHTRTRWRSQLPAPYNMTIYKGSTHIVASRGFVDYVLHSPPAQDFLQWCRRTSHAAEHFFNTLNRNQYLQVPGRYMGNKLEISDFKKMSMDLLRYKNWVPRYRCPGHKVVRRICILNVQDLPVLLRRPEPFANKFYADYSRVALQCLAEALHNRTRDQTLGQRDFNVTIYEQFASERDAYGIFS